MKIGIDIDDTITNTSQVALQYIRKNQEKFGKIDEMDEKLKLLMRGVFPDEFKAFYQTNIIPILDSVTVKEDVQQVIHELQEKGHQIYIITSRSNGNLGCDSYAYTEKFLNAQQIGYDTLIIDAGDKLMYCQENQIDVMIDDSAHICNMLNEHGIKTILFNSAVNASDDVVCARVNSWQEVRKYLLEEW